MGRPIPRRDPANLGEPCLFCEQLVWGAGTTPLLVRVVFHGVIPEVGMPDPPNGIAWHLEQGIDPFCGWSSTLSFGGNDWTCWYDSRTSEIQLELSTGGSFLYFTGDGPPCMSGPHENDIIPGTAYGYGGSAYILDLPLDYVLTIADGYGIAPDPRGLFDDQPAADPDQRVLRLASRTFTGSVQILFTPDDIIS